MTIIAETLKLDAFLRKHYPANMLQAYEDAMIAAAKGGDDDVFELGRTIFKYLDGREPQYRCPSVVEPEDRIEAKKALLGFFEFLAEKGHVTAMRFTASAYANGDNDPTVNRTSNGYSISVKPDFDKAAKWAKKAADCGDEIAKKIHESLVLRMSAPKK